MKIIKYIIDYLLGTYLTSYRTEDGRKMIIYPNGRIKVDMQDTQTVKIYNNYIKEHNIKYGPMMDMIIKNNRAKIEKDRRRCCCYHGE